MRGIMAAALSILLVMAGTVAASAHVKMTASVPKDGATVPEGLSGIQLDFSKPMRLTLVRVVRTKDQQQVPTTSELPKSFAKSAKLTVDALPAGSYEVSWTAVGDDGYVVSGSFKFSVSEAPRVKPTQ